jgi:hypothetical protein
MTQSQEKKLDQVHEIGIELRNTLRERGGVLDRLDGHDERFEHQEARFRTIEGAAANLDKEHAKLIARGLGVIAAVSAIATFASSELFKSILRWMH